MFSLLYSLLRWILYAGVSGWLVAVLATPARRRVLCRVMFGLVLMGTTVSAGLWCRLTTILPLGPSERSNLALAGTRLCWKLCFVLCPWVELRENDSNSRAWTRLVADLKREDALAKGGKEPRPMFLLSNHTSFLDTLACLTALPASVAPRTRTYMGNHLFKLPVLSTICRAIGHFPVYFTKSEYGKFSVDKDKMDVVQKQVDAHLKKGGQLAFFPEGQMNKTPDSLTNFRYGAFKKALEFDARLWAMTSLNFEKSWPLKEQIGGWPAVCMIDMQPLAADGCRALVAKLRAEDPSATDGQEDHALLANFCHDQMQAVRNSMLAKTKAE